MIDTTEGARIWTGHGVLAHNLIKIASDNGVSSFPSAQRDMRIDHVVMAGGRTDEANASGNVQIDNSDLDVERLDQT